MSFNRKDLADNLLRLNGNAHWGHYVQTLESIYNTQVEALLNSDHPDEALRGECRTLLKLLKTIHQNKGTTQ
jgi:hypothetical protein